MNLLRSFPFVVALTICFQMAYSLQISRQSYTDRAERC
jgi:hypothetical protein